MIDTCMLPRKNKYLLLHFTVTNSRTDFTIIIIIIIIIICYNIYAWYLQLYTWNKLMFLGYVVLQLILFLQCMAHVLLFPILNVFYVYISTFRSAQCGHYCCSSSSYYYY
jgi:hypothetical protein